MRRRPLHESGAKRNSVRWLLVPLRVNPRLSASERHPLCSDCVAVTRKPSNEPASGRARQPGKEPIEVKITALKWLRATR
jgi:hypothetical protein